MTLSSYETRFEKALHIARRWPVIPSLIVTTLVIFAIFAPLLSGHDPRHGSLRDRAIPPVWTQEGTTRFVLGTDNVGRDILTRIIYGTRISLMVAGIVLSSGMVIGTALGLVAGYAGGNIDELIMRAVDFTLAIPFIMVALVTVTVFGQSLEMILILLIIFSWGGFARQTRAMTLGLKTQDYVLLARVSGASSARILFRHILPGVLSTVMVLASLSIGGLILVESTLSFLGVGIPRPTAAWGSMVADGRDFLRTAWWMSTFPGIAIFATVLSVNFLGDWLRDYFDPRLRQL